MLLSASLRVIIHNLGVEMENVLKINAGIACSDRANEGKQLDYGLALEDMYIVIF
jgi:hypothetical protein